MEKIEPIDQILQQADFASEDPELEKRLWNRINRHKPNESTPDFQVLEDDALEDLAAAGSPFSSSPKDFER